MTPARIRLVRPALTPEAAGNLALLKRHLNNAGYDASNADIRWAWEQWSEFERSIGWHNPTVIAPADAVAAIREHLVESGEASQ